MRLSPHTTPSVFCGIHTHLYDIWESGILYFMIYRTFSLFSCLNPCPMPLWPPWGFSYRRVPPHPVCVVLGIDPRALLCEASTLPTEVCLHSLDKHCLSRLAEARSQDWPQQVSWKPQGLCSFLSCLCTICRMAESGETSEV